MTTLDSHIGGFVDSDTFQGTVDVSSGPAWLTFFELELAYYPGPLSGVTITFSAGGSPVLPVASPSTVPFVAGTKYICATNAANPVTYTIEFPAPVSAPFIMEARAASGYLSAVSTISALSGSFPNFTWTYDATVPSGQLIVLSFIGHRSGGALQTPTPTGFTHLLGDVAVSSTSTFEREAHVWWKRSTGDTSVAITVPTAYSGSGRGFLITDAILADTDDPTNPQVAHTDYPSTSYTALTPTVTRGLGFGVAGAGATLTGGGSTNPWQTIQTSSGTGTLRTVGRSTFAGTMTANPLTPATSEGSIFGAFDLETGVDSLPTGDVPQSGWRIGSNRIGIDTPGF